MSQLKPEGRELVEALNLIAGAEVGTRYHVKGSAQLNVWQLAAALEATDAQKKAADAALSNAKIMFWSTIFAAVSAGGSAVSAFFTWWRS